MWNKDFRIEIPDDAFLKKYPLEFKYVFGSRTFIHSNAIVEYTTTIEYRRMIL